MKKNSEVDPESLDEVLGNELVDESATGKRKTLEELYLNESNFSQIHELLCKGSRMSQSG